MVYLVYLQAGLLGYHGDVKPDWNEIKRFKPEERQLFSPDIGPASSENLNHTLLVRLDCLAEVVAAQAGRRVPFVITSGYRSPAHNKKVGGAAGSLHMKGRAVDLSTVHMSRDEKQLLLKYARACGFVGIGVARTYIHLDIRENKTPVAWRYADGQRPAIPVGQEWEYA
jgi:uncharacterized protein YcbK (DUF882 family)